MATGGDDGSDFIEPASDNVSFNTEDLGITSNYDPTIDGESIIGSVSSSVYAHCHEHGRRYHMYKYGRYPIPNDDLECGREGLRHALFKEMLDGRLHLAPIGQHPQKIIDLGTGFGDWVIEMGEQFPSAEVVGLDLSPIQPNWVPPNVKFVVDDIEEEQWLHGSDYDYIHMRMTAVTVKSPIQVTTNMFRHLKPGGWVEFQEVSSRVCCNDDSMPDDYVMTRFYDALHAVLAAKYGYDTHVAERLPAELERIGFVSVQRKVVHVPIGFWSKDPRRMHTAFLYREVLADFLPALGLKPFGGHRRLPPPRRDDNDGGGGGNNDDGDDDGGEEDEEEEETNAAGMDQFEVDHMFAEVKEALCGKTVHAYVPFHFVWAQKPLQ